MRKMFFLLLALVMALAACGPQTQTGSGAGDTVSPTETTGSTAMRTPAGPTVSPQPATAAPSVIVTPRAEMQATDPATVTLASGRPQLIEFFAFW